MLLRPATDRAAGVLLHPTSLPGRGIGELGAPAHAFVDWLAGAGQTLWQLLPLVPVDGGGSPYNGLAAAGGNPLLVDLDGLRDDGLLGAHEVAAAPRASGERVDFPAVARWKRELLGAAYDAFRAGRAPALAPEFDAFRHAGGAWLDELSLFLALRAEHGGVAWTDWPYAVRAREPAALNAARARLAEEMVREAFAQFLVARQWARLRDHAQRRGVRLVGDVPIFVALDSVDVWARRELFRVDEAGRPEVVAGVPPDYFSETGQRWGNPLYDWAAMRRAGYDWWIERLRRTLEQVDVVRVDHFRGFAAFWEIPADEPTALHGAWRPGPGAELFHALRAGLGALPLIAEDLGLITPDVEALRAELGLPGMRVLQFAFDGDPRNPHLPENYVDRCVAYPGTHDNDTLAGWWAGASPQERERARRFFDPAAEPPHRALLRLVWDSPANWAIVQLQDLLGLGNASRMNRPGTTVGNWSWRVDGAALAPDVQHGLLALTIASGRVPQNRGGGIP